MESKNIHRNTDPHKPEVAVVKKLQYPNIRSCKNWLAGVSSPIVVITLCCQVRNSTTVIVLYFQPGPLDDDTNNARLHTSCLQQLSPLNDDDNGARLHPRRIGSLDDNANEARLYSRRSQQLGPLDDNANEARHRPRRFHDARHSVTMFLHENAKIDDTKTGVDLLDSQRI